MCPFDEAGVGEGVGDLDTGALRIRQARVDVNGRDTIVPTKTERSARDRSLPPRELAMLKAMRTAHLRERLAVSRTAQPSW